MQPTKLTPDMPCYDCGSTITGHHTFFCAFAGPADRRDLPAKFGTQHWDGQRPIATSEQKLNALYESLPADRPLPRKVLIYYEQRLRALT